MEKEVFLIKLGERIREIRKEKGLTQTQLAHLVGKDQQVIHRLEIGDFNPSHFFVYQVAEGLGVKLEEIITNAKPE